MGFAMPSRLWPGRRNLIWVPGNQSQVGVDQDDWLVCEVRLPSRVDVSGCACGQPLSQPSDCIRPVGDDPEGNIDSAAGVFRRVEPAAPELGGTPVPGDDHAAEKARKVRVFGEADDDVKVPDTSAATQVMLGAALCEGGDAHPILPVGKMWVADKERFELSFCGAPQPSKIGFVKALVRARRIAANTFSMRHVRTDVTAVLLR